MNAPEIDARVARYYTDKVAAHGATPRGVDWNSLASQQLRFDQLLRVLDADGPVSLTDYGCGYGALLDHAAADRRIGAFQGYDLAPAMVARARERHGGRPATVFTADAAALQSTDFVVASGIFNVRLDVGLEAWEQHVLRTLDHLAGLGARGFAFNMLTAYSDPDRMRDDLYYADPGRWFDHCKRRLAPRIALLHDYPLWEFTILARK